MKPDVTHKTFGIANKYLLIVFVALVGLASIVTGTLSSVTADYFIGDGSNLTAVDAGTPYDYIIHNASGIVKAFNSTTNTYDITNNSGNLSEVLTLAAIKGNVSIAVKSGYYEDKGTAIINHSNVTINFMSGVDWNISSTGGAVVVAGRDIARTNLTTNYSAGVATIVVTTASGLVVGDKLFFMPNATFIDTDGSYNWGKIDAIEIAGIAGTTITLKSKTVNWWNSSYTNLVSARTVDNVHLIGQGRIRNDFTSASDNLLTFRWAWAGSVEGLNLGQKTGTSRAIVFSQQSPITNGVGAVYGTAHMLAKNNRILYSSENGIETYEVSFDNVIEGNTIETAGTGSIGWGISSRGTNNKIINNNVKNSTLNNIDVQVSRNTIISGNHLSGCGQAGCTGITAGGSAVRGVIVTNNIVTGSASYAIKVSNDNPKPGDVIITNNYAYGTGIANQAQNICYSTITGTNTTGNNLPTAYDPNPGFC